MKRDYSKDVASLGLNDKDIGIIVVPDTFIPTDLQTAASSMALGQSNSKFEFI